MPPTVITKSLITPLTGSMQTSTVGEPSVSANGTEALFSGNWYAAHSVNAGLTWNLIDPFTFFPAAAGGFCCDQTLIFIPKIRMHVWVLQYIKANNTNVLRIAFKQTKLGTQSGWKWWDLVPATFNPQWSTDWFDYNHAALSDNFLYVGTNMFAGATDSFQRAVMFRIPFTAFQTGNLAVERFATSANFSLRCVQGATTRMYFGSHEGGLANKLRIFAWPENTAAVTSAVVPITPWNGASPYGPVGPGASNWIGRCDGRITGAWAAKGRLGFMWTANKQGTARPFPFVRVARIDEAKMKLIDEPDIWSGSIAYAYPDACPNDQGDLGITLFAGGNQWHPLHLIGVRAAAATSWSLAPTAKSTHSPTQPKWGDYLTCRRDNPTASAWVASGYSLQGGGAIANIAPHFVRFKM
jgi:hypothetical protein